MSVFSSINSPVKRALTPISSASWCIYLSRERAFLPTPAAGLPAAGPLPAASSTSTAGSPAIAALASIAARQKAADFVSRMAAATSS
jgi:hypothetical protein